MYKKDYLTFRDLADMSEEEIFHFSNSTNIENWFHDLEDYTIPSRFISLTLKEVKYFSEAIFYHYQPEEFKEILPDRVEGFLSELIRRMDMEIKAFGSAFVRLSMRSPKDSTVAIAKGKLEYEQALSDAHDAGDNYAKNLLIIKAQKYGLRVESGKEALDLLLSSERIRNDLEDCLKFKYEPKVIIRKWLDIPEYLEFRGFIRKRKIVGLSQYFYFCKFEQIHKNKDRIESQIGTFFEEIKDKLHLESCILDFAFYKDRVLVLELNPFFIGSGSCLFNWKEDKFETYEFRYVQ